MSFTRSAQSYFLLWGGEGSSPLWLGAESGQMLFCCHVHIRKLEIPGKSTGPLAGRLHPQPSSLASASYHVSSSAAKSRLALHKCLQCVIQLLHHTATVSHTCSVTNAASHGSYIAQQQLLRHTAVASPHCCMAGLLHHTASCATHLLSFCITPLLSLLM